MYPTRELIRLARHKAILQRKSAAHRTEIAAASSRLTQPLHWVAHVWHLWRRLAPYALVGGVASRLFSPRSTSRLGRLVPWLLRWGPIAAGILRGSGRASRSPSVRLTPFNSSRL